MILYILPILYCLVAIYHFDISGNRKQRLFYYSVLLVYLIFLSGLSYRIGSDAPFYAESFRNIPTIGNITIESFQASTYQPLYFLLCVVCKSIIPDIWFMHLCQSWIVCAVMFNFIRKRTEYIFSGALLFIICIYFYFCFEILKESLAVSMLLLGFPYLQKKKYFKFYLFAGLALSFHLSGIIAFFIPFLLRIRLDKFFFIWIIITFCVMELLKNYASYILFGEIATKKYDYYVEVATNRYNTNWFIDSFLRNVLVPLVAGIWLKWTYRKVPFEWAYCVYILLGIGTLEYALIFERPINYFLPFVVLSLGDLLGRSFKKGLARHMATVAVCVVFWLGCRGLFYMRNDAWRLLLPYESIFIERVDSHREKVIRNIH